MITRWSAGIADQNMDEEILVKLASTVKRHPWWRARARLALDLLRRVSVFPPATVLEAGCGWGVNLELLEQAGYRATGLDISRKCLEMLNHSGRTLIEADLSAELPKDIPQYQAVLALDVIEHIDDDQAVVARLYRLAHPGGYLILSVPALPELYSEFDRIQGHRRRYTPETVRRAFSHTGFEVQDVIWWGQWMTKLLARSRSREKGRAGENPTEIYRRHLSLPPWPAPKILDVLFMLEHRRTLAGRNEVGTSLFAIARRP